MIRLYLNHELCTGKMIALNSSQYNYLINVMRLQNGDEVEVFDNKTGSYVAIIDNVKRGNATLAIAKKKCDLQIIQPQITLAFALVKKNAIETIVQKATELGVTALQPLITKHTVVNTINNDRLSAQIIEASEQTTRNTLPALLPVLPMQQWFDNRIKNIGNNTDCLIICDERRRDAGMAKALLSLSPYDTYTILIGPEGGFANEELDRIIATNHCVPISMGPRILRADTAAIAALSVCRGILGDW